MTLDVTDERIAAEVRAEMARKQRTQRELGEVLGIDQTSVSLRLAGKRPFRAAELARVAAFLDVPVTQFLPASAAA